MATVAASRSGAGGKIVTNRRKQRLCATPYDRPPPPSKSPSWFTGVIIPSARALASGAGKILTAAVFSDSGSSSSEDEDSVSDDINDHDSYYGGDNALDERNGTSSQMMQHGEEPQFGIQRTETKWIIEQLIRQETFSREECNRLIKVLNSRVMGSSSQVGEKISLEHFPENTVNHEDVDAFNKAVLESKKWFQEKKVGSSSVAELARGTCNLNSIALEHVENAVCSPVDIARSYMRDRPLWDSPTRHAGLRTPSTATMKLFKEGTPYSASHNASASSNRWSSLASGPWNIQEELRRVRSKATDLLMDVGVSSDPALVATESRQDVNANEAPSSNPAVSVSGNNEDTEAVKIDGECAREIPATEAAEFGGSEYINGFASVSPEATMVQNHKHQDEQNNHVHTANKDKSTNIANIEGDCELLTEAGMEIPEMDKISNGSQNSMGLQYEESSMEMTQPSSKVEEEDMSEKQKGGKPGRDLRRSTRKR